jgi:hypothetical protein
MRRYGPIIALLAAVLVSSGCAAYQTPPAYGHEPAPRVAVSAPEFLYVIPSFGVYFVPNISAEIFFVNGRWYYSASGAWYWGASYGGPWTYIEVRHVPRYLRRLPRDYRTRYRNEYYRVPYGHWQKRRQQLPPRVKSSPPPYVQKYNRYKGLWYQGKTNTGPWRYPEIGFLPKAIKKLPPEYREKRPDKPPKQIPWPKVEKKYRRKMEKRDREWKWEDDD